MKGGNVIWLLLALVLRFQPILDPAAISAAVKTREASTGAVTSNPSPPVEPYLGTAIDPDG
jgi:hypothetical protein